MNSRTTLLLALLALVITPMSYLAVRDARPSYVVGDARPFSFAIPAVVSVEIERGEQQIRIEKSAAGWDIVAPVVDRGRYASIEDLLQVLRDLEIRGEGPDDLKSSGLETPQIVVTVQSPSRTYRLELGSDHPSLPRVHARIGDRPVLIAAEVRDALRDFELDEIRDDAVCGASPGRVQRVLLERPGQPPIELIRAGVHWQLAAPYSADANPAVVEQWLTRIAQWAAVDYIDPPLPERLGLETPRAKLTVQLTDGSVKTVEVGALYTSKISQTVAVRCSGRRSPLVAAGRLAQELIELQVSMLVSPYLVRIDQPRIRALSLTGGAHGKVDLELQSAGGWKMRWAGDSSAVPAEAQLVERWSERLRQLRAIDRQPIDRSSLQLWGFDRPLVQVALITEEGNPERILFGAEVQQGSGIHYVWNPRQQSVAEVKVDDLEQLIRAPFSLRDHRVTSVTAGELRRFRITTPDGGEALLALPNQTWRCQGREQVDLPQPDVRWIARTLSQLMARNWAPDDPTAPGPQQYQLKAELFGLTGSEPQVTIYVGETEADGHRRGRIDQWVFSVVSSDGPDLVNFCDQLLQQLDQE
ncbi:MAG: DUF4340 domain-containing protein [Planctomycetota bacterium]|nr:DUF4340 domain-containing protein [Planctomycetota bacterium]